MATWVYPDQPGQLTVLSMLTNRIMRGPMGYRRQDRRGEGMEGEG